MIITVGGVKGGCGKTTIAINLTVLRAKEGVKTLLVDADEQGTASDWVETRISLGRQTEWSTIRLSGKSIDFQIGKIKKGFDDVIIDVGGRDTTSQRSALLISDIFIIPFKPRSFDIWTLGKVKCLINDVKSLNKKLVCLSLINEADPYGIDNAEARKILSSCDELICLDCQIGRRKAFGNACSDGLGVIEIKKNADQKAISEIVGLHNKIYKEHKKYI